MKRALAAAALLLGLPAVRGGELPRAGVGGAGARPPSRRTKYVAHFMPWFEGPSTESYHWCSPERGNSYYESVLGRYDSSDPSTYKKQLGLMRAAGLDGLWINLQLASWLPRVRAIAKEAGNLGLRFAVVVDTYNEERIVRDLSEPLAALMRMPNYYRVDDRPILPIFEHPGRWGGRPTVLPDWKVGGRRPFIIGTFMSHSDEDQALPPGYDSLFFWHSPDLSWLEHSYYKSKRFSVKVGSVFRGWREAYKSVHHHPPYLGYLSSTLRLAEEQAPEFAQLVTWNDYTEGTMLEPSFLRGGAGCSDNGGPHLADIYWSNRSASCAQLHDGGGAQEPRGCEIFANGKPCTPAAGAARGSPCCGSGRAPCADVEDCSKPLGAAQGPGAPACRRGGGGKLSAYSELAAVAASARGATAAEAMAAFVAVVFGREGEAAESSEAERNGTAPAEDSPGAEAFPTSTGSPVVYLLVGLFAGAIAAFVMLAAAARVSGRKAASDRPNSDI